jgi:GT2 family glycosyltransferase/SAM-dependent methyltransferase
MATVWGLPHGGPVRLQIGRIHDLIARMPRRNANAPRLIDWTGERFVPWTFDVQVAYEHVHRYLWARELAGGRRVLDVGCGEGYGSAMLAEVAADVRAIDIDETTVRHARFNYASASVGFAIDDANTLSTVEDGSVDLVVAFEVIEHVEDPARVLDACRRVLRPGGVLVVSTPNRTLYSEQSEQDNPFHLHELDDTEFREAVSSRFAHTTFRSQRAQSGSRIDPMDAPEAEPSESVFRVEYLGGSWQEVSSPPPFYMLAVASDDPLPGLSDGSSLVDYTLAIVRQAGEDAAARITAAYDDASRSAKERERLRLELTQQRESVSHLRQDLSTAHESLALAVGELETEMVRHAQADKSALEELDYRRQQVAVVSESISWKVLQRVRGRLLGTGERRTLRGRAVSLGLRGARRLARPTEPSTPVVDATVQHLADWRARGARIRLPTHTAPRVSVLIPTYDNPELLGQCLMAIAREPIATAFEVIVVDDGNDAATAALLEGVHGVRVVRNAQNLGYLRSVNRGAAEARGSVLVLLNDDTNPQAGWLDHLLDRLDRPGVGAVGAKLVYPDGPLQEAGGIVWADGSAWNYGNRDASHAPAYRFARPVDYCSAAALAVDRELWDAVGGFDEVYGPGYYEDVDLCFAIRAAGSEVWYEPRSVVIHHEGASHGTDEGAGTKRHQVINRVTFAERWAAELRTHHPVAGLDVAADAADRRAGPIVLVVDHMVPEPDHDAGSARMLIVLELLTELGARAVFLPDNGAPTPGYSEDLEALGIEVLSGPLDLFGEMRRRASACTLVVLSRPTVTARFLPTVRELIPGALVAFDTVDLHHLREAQRAELEGLSPGIAVAYEKLELAMADATDVTLTTTEDERTHLLSVRPELDVRVVPLGNRPRTDPAPAREGREGHLFIGGFRHLPNTEAALRLGRGIAAAARRHGSTDRIAIVGPDPPAVVRELAGGGIDVPGWVEHLDPLLDSSVALVAPLSYGAGMKGKVTMALAAGLPVITTAIGAQGLGLEHERDALIVETDEEFGAAMARLEREPALWAALSARGPEVVRERCSPEVIRGELERLLRPDGD